jgi:hypothetical protein
VAVNEIIKWRRAGKAYLTEVDHVTVAVSKHPAGGWQWCTNRDNGLSGYDPGLADAKEHAVQFTRLWLADLHDVDNEHDETADIVADAVAQERAAVVAYLRRAAWWDCDDCGFDGKRLVEAIELRLHRAGEEA